MKRVSKILAAALILAAVGTAAFAQKTELKFSTGEWAPYTSEKMPGGGAVTEIVAAAGAAAGFAAKFEFVPWKRAEQNVVDAAVFAAFPYFVLPERVAKPEVFAHSDPLCASVISILYYKKAAGNPGAFKFAKPADLKGKGVAVLQGTMAVATPLANAGVKFEEVTDHALGLKMLEAGRVQYVIDDRAVLWNQVKTSYPDRVADFGFLDANFSEKSSTVLLVSKKYPGSDALLAKFNEGLKKIKADGTLKKILDKYGLLM